MFEKQYVESESINWFSISESVARYWLGKYYDNVDAVIDEMKSNPVTRESCGLIVRTPWALYRYWA